MINWSVCKEDDEKIIQLAKAAMVLLRLPVDAYRLLLMDLTACHANGCELDLDRMLTAAEEGESYDLTHDLQGIRQNIDRETGQLLNGFSPRFAKPAEPTEE